MTFPEFREQVQEKYWEWDPANEMLVFEDREGRIERLLYQASDREAEIRSMWGQYKLREGLT